MEPQTCNCSCTSGQSANDQGRQSANDQSRQSAKAQSRQSANDQSRQSANDQTADGKIHNDRVYYRTVHCQGTTTAVPVVLSHDSVSWTTNETICTRCFDFPKTTMATQLGKTPIYIYDEKEDGYISERLKTQGKFESDKLDIIHQLLDEEPDTNLIDIGANIGNYTLINHLLVLLLYATDMVLCWECLY